MLSWCLQPRKPHVKLCLMHLQVAAEAILASTRNCFVDSEFARAPVGEGFREDIEELGDAAVSDDGATEDCASSTQMS